VSSVLVAALLASAAFAGPVQRSNGKKSLSISKKVNKAALKGFVARDKARARSYASSLLRRQEEAPATNEAVSYIAEVGVGSQTFDLIIDTGSSNTWVGAGTKYKKSSTGTSTGKKVSVSYGSGSFSGTEYTDTVTISDDLVISKQSVGVASKSTGFSGVDGILGIGPVSLTEGTVSGVSSVPTVVDNLYSQGLIDSAVVAVSFAPTTEEEDQNGVLTYGGPDDSLYTGDITYVDVTSTSPASEYWGIDQDVTYNGTTLLSSSGIVDTGTTLIYIATDAYTKYVKATGAKLDSTTGLLKVTAAQYAALKPLNFVIGGTTFALSANAQLWPRSLNTYMGGTASSYYLVVNDLGSDSGEGLDFINGQTFLERFYSVFDTTNGQVGLATTENTDATTN